MRRATIRSRLRRFVAAFVAVGISPIAFTRIAGCRTPEAQPASAQMEWRPIHVAVRAVALGAENIGSLHFAGGLELDSDEPAFGGVSGLEVDSNGRFLAVTDAGSWLTGRVVLDARSGDLRDVKDVSIAPLLDENGARLRSKRDVDAEDLALEGERAIVSFERTQTIRIYDIAEIASGKPPGAAMRGPPLDGVGDLAENEGLEALAAFGDGRRLVVGSERADARGARIWVTSIDATVPSAPVAHLPLENGYGLVSLDRLPDGDFVAVERAYSPELGVRIRVLRVRASTLSSEEELHPEMLAQLLPPLVLDNFEGVSAVLGPHGGVRLYLVSDDNFSRAQHTLLYAFDLAAAPPS